MRNITVVRRLVLDAINEHLKRPEFKGVLDPGERVISFRQGPTEPQMVVKSDSFFIREGDLQLTIAEVETAPKGQIDVHSCGVRRFKGWPVCNQWDTSFRHVEGLLYQCPHCARLECGEYRPTPST